MFTPLAVIIGLVYILLPFSLVMPLYSSIGNWIARRWKRRKISAPASCRPFIRIIIPLTMPGIIAGCLLVMLPAMGLFHVSDPMGGAKEPAGSATIKSQFLHIRDWPFGAATSNTNLTLVMGLMLLIYWRAARLLNKKGGAGMIGRRCAAALWTAIYAYLYIPIIILIVNSFNRSRFGIVTGRGSPPTGIAC